ncbi:carbon-nitrogen hydrolase family protein [Spelaeicoccus albus]|uniref:Putative amidohydrolase n=1 Tax=Spelaeicoccus albus TaxID=1280376 RepID=A0A7Z0A7M6_9MICO|nr:carbon-nitrogen hydrolase family protein [Spelaeicoccus albus]NYI65924.1 putative amidohydrolase [Spelaeicoccus albus]
MSVLRIAGLQTPGTPGDVEANLAELDSAAGEAAAAGARLLITPEMFVTGYDIGDGVRETDGLTQRVAEIARQRAVGVLAGLPARRPGGIANSAVFVKPDGTVAAEYDKTHLFASLDKTRFAAGDRLTTIVDFDGVGIGVLICYDVEFPEAARALAMAGAQLIAVPTANMVPFDFICTSVIPVRAWENQTYVAYINHSGSERDTVYAGQSSIVGPDGVPLAAAASDGRTLLVADIDTDIVQRARADNPYLTDRRPDLYGPATDRHRPVQ